ncbi:MAG: hypothetical protein HZB38_13235 [Planctomycetes bacterium]|nr:hypothetical protein [Planctomycetota bacterium]
MDFGFSRRTSISRLTWVIPYGVLVIALTACERPPATAQPDPPSSAPTVGGATTRPATPPSQPTADAILQALDAALSKAPNSDGTNSRLAEWERQILAISDHEKSNPLLERLGAWAARCGRPDTAARCFRAVLAPLAAARSPEAAPGGREIRVRVGLARSLLALEADLEADAVLRGALAATDPNADAETQIATADAAYLLGGIARYAGRLQEAQPLAEQAVMLRTARLGETHLDTLLARVLHARVMIASGLILETEGNLKQLLEDCRRIRGESDLVTTLADFAFAECEIRLPGRFQPGMERLTRDATALLDAPQALALERLDVLRRAVELLEAKRDYRAAENLLGTALAAAERNASHLPPTLVARRRLSLAANLVRQSRYADAQALADSVINEIGANESASVEAAAVVGDGYLLASDTARREKRFVEARRLCEAAIATHSRNTFEGEAAVQVALAKLISGWILLEEDDWIAAEGELSEALTVLQQRLGETDWRVGQARSLLGWSRMKQMRLEDAEEDLVYGTRIILGRRGPDDDGLASLRRVIELYDIWGNADVANFYRKLLPEEHDHAHEDDSH